VVREWDAAKERYVVDMLSGGTGRACKAENLAPFATEFQRFVTRGRSVSSALFKSIHESQTDESLLDMMAFPRGSEPIVLYSRCEHKGADPAGATQSAAALKTIAPTPHPPPTASA